VIPLGRAWLCANCDTVGADAGRCARCGSRALAHLGRLLDRAPLTPADAAVARLLETVEEKREE